MPRPGEVAQERTQRRQGPQHAAAGMAPAPGATSAGKLTALEEPRHVVAHEVAVFERHALRPGSLDERAELLGPLAEGDVLAGEVLRERRQVSGVVADGGGGDAGGGQGWSGAGGGVEGWGA